MSKTANAVSIRAAIFIGLVVLSLPLAYPVGVFILDPLLSWILPSPLPDTPFWHSMDDLLFDLPANWPYLVLAPGLGASLDGPYVISYAIPVTSWAVIAIAYGWLTRRIRTLYAGLGVLPTVCLIGHVVVIARGI